MYKHRRSLRYQCLPAVTAFGNCATTPAIFGHRQFLVTVKGPFRADLPIDTQQLQQQCKMLQSESATQQDVITAGLCLMVADLQCIVAVRLTHLQNSDTLDTRALHALKISNPAGRPVKGSARPGPVHCRKMQARPSD